MGLVSELRRRNVLRMAVLYAVAAWLIMQVAEVVIALANLPNWIGPTILGLLAVGFPIAMIFSWLYEITTEGISLEKDVDREESITHFADRRLDFLVISLLCAAVILFAYDKWWTSAPSEHSIAVLPFVNMSNDASNEYFSDGISEEILNLLTQVPDLLVISRSSAFSFKGQNVDIPTIAAKLNVAHVLQGSVRKSGNELRITAQLIKVETDRHLWSKTYDRELKNVFAIQDEIAAAVADALTITLLGDKPESAETDLEAFALYLQARQFVHFATPAGLKQAEAQLTQALDIDPTFAPAWTELSHVYRQQASVHAVRPNDEGFELARHAVQQALTLDPRYGPAYVALAQIEGGYDWDFTAASQHLDKALMLNPNDAYTLRVVAGWEYVRGHLDKAIELNRRVIVLDPVFSSGHWSLGRSLYAARRLEAAAESFRTARALNPGGVKLQYQLGQVLLAQGDVHAALATMELEISDGYRLPGIAIVQHALGNAEASDAALQKLIEERAATSAYQVAEVYAFRGEIDDAFDWLERAYDNRDNGLTKMLPDPLLANLHDDPRWFPFLDKMGLPH